MKPISPLTADTIYSRIGTALGEMLILSREEKLTGLYFADRPHARVIPTIGTQQDDFHLFVETARQLDEYAAGKRKVFDLPIALSGTPFRVQVWNELLKIPFGETVTYTEIAELLDKPDAVRAVGTATGTNPISIIVPCHRVVGKCGTQTGYSGGLPRKNALLNFESGATETLEEEVIE